MARQEAIESAATLGNLFVSMNIGGKSAATMSTRLVSLASDLASFNNTSTSDAYEALRSGLVGETEPLRQFGVNINDAQLKLVAFQMGLTKSVKVDTLPPAIKAMAAYKLILDQTKTAQGDFARTSAGAANTTRIMQAQVKDAWANVGQYVLPISLVLLHTVAGLLGRFNSFAQAHPNVTRVLVVTAAVLGGLLIAVGAVITSVGALRTAWGTARTGATMLGNAVTFMRTRLLLLTTGYYQNLVAVGAWRTANSAAHYQNLRQVTGLATLRLALVGAKVQLVGATTAAWGFVAALLANPITWVVAGVVALGAALVYAWKHSETFRNVTTKAFQTVLYWVGFVVGVVTGAVPKGFSMLVQHVAGTLRGLVDIVAGAAKVVRGLFTGNMDLVQQGAEQALGGVKAVWGNTAGTVLGLAPKFVAAGAKIGENIAAGVKSKAAQVVSSVRDVASRAVDGAKSAWSATVTGASNLASRLRATGQRLGAAIVARRNAATTPSASGAAPSIVARRNAAPAPSTNGAAAATRFKLPQITGAGTGANIARAAVQGLTAGWAESIPGYCSRFVRQVFNRVLGPQTQKLFGASAMQTEKIWRSQGLAKSLAAMGGKAALKAGDVLFQGFGSGGYGHTGIYDGKGGVIQNTTLKGGGKMVLPLSAFGTITSVGRVPSAPIPAPPVMNAPAAPEPPRPQARQAAQPGRPNVSINTINLPNVQKADDFPAELKRVLEAHQ